MPHLSREQIREIDRLAAEEFGLAGVVLMENAGRGATEVLLGLGVHGPVVICCGKGNNGGDGFVIARHLDNRALAVKILLFCQPNELTGDAAIHYQILARSRVEVCAAADSVVDDAALRCEFDRAEWIVDALFGTGLRGPVRPPFEKVIKAINASRARVLAVDLPSGLDANTGESLGATVNAEHTVTFVAPKAGFANPAARPHLGSVHVVDIGVPRILLDRFGLSTP